MGEGEDNKHGMWWGGRDLVVGRAMDSGLLQDWKKGFEPSAGGFQVVPKLWFNELS